MNMMANIPIKCANYAKSHAVHFNKEVRQELIKKTQVRERDSSTLKQTLSLHFLAKRQGHHFLQPEAFFITSILLYYAI
jgi:hypothetical protein